jgi:uncharacterized membrane protein YeaQ/YmgE (transglycosylase-associated protein family)
MAMKLFLTALLTAVVGMVFGASGEHFEHKRVERFGFFLLIFAGFLGTVSALVLIWSM